MSYRTVTQKTCPHDAKLKMPGYTDRYECTRCQKIIFQDTSKKEEAIKDNAYTEKYQDNDWEDD